MREGGREGGRERERELVECTNITQGMGREDHRYSKHMHLVQIT